MSVVIPCSSIKVTFAKIDWLHLLAEWQQQE